ncbi:MAG: hypothetical protein L6R41_004452 [Letrouitia leprolyta]|nr:MAG: hypothetical protein L6R41_004452 [Letrouitia leprolyta]
MQSSTVRSRLSEAAIVAFPFKCLSADTIVGQDANGSVHRINDFVVFKVPTNFRPGRDGVIPLQNEIQSAEENIAEEKKWYSILGSIPHPHILQSFMSTSEGIFLPLMCTTLKHYISMPGDRPCELRTKYRWTKEIASAAAFLESMQLAHCDFRPLNIFIDSDKHVKLGDFDTISRYGEVPTLDVAPDWVWYDPCCGPKHDLFGIGNTLWELYTGKEYQWGTPEEPRFPPETTGVELGHVISKCWNSEYVTISELVKEVESLYLKLVYGVFAPVIYRAPLLMPLLGEKPARVLSEPELACGRASIEKFLLDQSK